MKTKLLAISSAVSGGLLSLQVQAASALDAGMKTSVTDGFTTLKDTVLDVLSTTFPYILGVMAVLAAPAIVRKLFKMASKG